MTKPNAAIQRRYTPDDLRSLWDFCQHDFERFLELLVWLETLPAKDHGKQIDASNDIRRSMR